MFAIVETGGKQFRVEEGLEIQVAKLKAEAGTDIELDKVLMIGGDTTAIGTPYVDKAKVTCEVLGHGRDKKVVVFKKLRRQDHRKKTGHRQDFTTLKVKAIQA